MSYHTWSTDGYGFCVDHINTTTEKVVALASTDKDLLSALQLLAEEIGCELNKLTLEDLDKLEGDCCERGLTHILKTAISRELPVIWADNFDGQNYILLEPIYPWSRYERDYSREEVDEIYKKYIKFLTDEEIDIDYQSVENGG